MNGQLSRTAEVIMLNKSASGSSAFQPSAQKALTLRLSASPGFLNSCTLTDTVSFAFFNHGRRINWLAEGYLSFAHDADSFSQCYFAYHSFYI